MNLSYTGRTVAALAGLFTLASTTQAQTILVEEGDQIGTVGLCTRIDDVTTNNVGDWAVRLSTDASNDFNEVILVNGAIKFSEGTSTGITAPTGATFNFLDAAILTNNGDEYYLFDVDLTSGSTADIVQRNGQVIIQQDVTPLTAPTAPSGSIWGTISEIWVNDNNQMLVGGRLSVTNEDVLVLMELDASGAITSQTLFAMDGMTLPGHPTPIQGFSFNRRRGGINNAGTTLWFVDDDHTVAGGSTSNDSWIYQDNTPLYREGDQIPAFPTLSVWGSWTSGELDINSAGDVVAQVGRDGSFTMDVITLNGTQIIAQEGTTVSQVPGGFTLTTIGSLSGPTITDNGDVLWFGDWDDPDTTIDSALFLNQEIVFQEGVSLTPNSVIIDTIANSDKGYQLSRNGEYLAIEFTDDNGLNGAYLYQLDPTLGDNFCDPVIPNSSGFPGRLVAVGSDLVADNDVVFNGSNLARNAFSFIITSQTAVPPVIVANSMGNICLGGSVGRVVGGVIPNTGPTGTFSITADLTALPDPILGTRPVLAGETWNFQAWFRDNDMGMLTSNLTNGVAITFN